jgi:hypothetical protein
MPYKLSKDGLSVLKEDGELVKKHDSHKEALAHLRALEANVEDAKSFSALKFSKMMGMGGAEYARSEAWDIAQCANAISFIAGMAMNEVDEPDDMQSIANILRGLMEFMNGEIQEMVNAAKQGESYEKSTVPAQVKTELLDLSYIKSIGSEIAVNKLAAKYVGKNTIAHPVFIWGDAKKTDLEAEYFTKESDFWDIPLKDANRFLTWEHGQDDRFASFEPNPVIGKTVKFYDDDIARWAESVIETDKKYRKYIDQFIEEKRLGYSSDSAPQYVQRVKQGKATWLKSWPWFGGSLTASPCEPRMKEFTPEFLKSLGIAIPDSPSQDWQADKAILDYFKIKYQIGD